jgi:IS5 family transposase
MITAGRSSCCSLKAVSDHKGARIVLNALPKADCLIADKGYDSTWFRQELLARASLSDLAKRRTAECIWTARH